MHALFRRQPVDSHRQAVDSLSFIRRQLRKFLRSGPRVPTGGFVGVMRFSLLALAALACAVEARVDVEGNTVDDSKNPYEEAGDSTQVRRTRRAAAPRNRG